MLELSLSLNQRAVSSGDPQEVLRRKHSLNALGQDYIIAADEKLDPVHHGCLEVDLYNDVTISSHSGDHSFLFGHSWCEMDVIPGHPLQSSFFDAPPKLGEGAMDYSWIQLMILYFSE